MKEIFETKEHMYIIMECIQGGELFDHIKNKEMPEKEAAFVAYQILEALQYLHISGIVHRDLKPENLLIEKDPATNMVIQTKIADFGLSKIIVPNEKMHDACGTPAYVAPEVLKKSGYYSEVDVWSTGVIFYTMLSRCLPFHSYDRKQTFRLIKEADPDLETGCWELVSEECRDLIGKMLKKEPEERISV